MPLNLPAALWSCASAEDDLAPGARMARSAAGLAAAGGVATAARLACCPGRLAVLGAERTAPRGPLRRADPARPGAGNQDGRDRIPGSVDHQRGTDAGGA